MRTTTVGTMLDILSYNYNHKNESAYLFEECKVFLPKNAGELPDEPEKLSIGMYKKGIDFFDIKGVLEAVFDGLNMKGVVFERMTDNPMFHPGRAAKLVANGEMIGFVGEVHPEVCENFEIGLPCYVAELDIEKMLECVDNNIKYKALPKFPAAERDIAVLIDVSATVGELEATMIKASGDILESIRLFDVYEGDRVPEGKKSVAFSLKFRAADRSLTSEEVNRVFNKIVKDLEYKNKAQLR